MSVFHIYVQILTEINMLSVSKLEPQSRGKTCATSDLCLRDVSFWSPAQLFFVTNTLIVQLFFFQQKMNVVQTKFYSFTQLQLLTYFCSSSRGHGGSMFRQKQVRLNYVWSGQCIFSFAEKFQEKEWKKSKESRDTKKKSTYINSQLSPSLSRDVHPSLKSGNSSEFQSLLHLPLLFSPSLVMDVPVLQTEGE